MTDEVSQNDRDLQTRLPQLSHGSRMRSFDG